MRKMTAERFEQAVKEYIQSLQLTDDEEIRRITSCYSLGAWNVTKEGLIEGMKAYRELLNDKMK